MRIVSPHTRTLLAVAMAGALWSGDAAAGIEARTAIPSKAYGPDFSLPNRPGQNDPNADTAVTEYDLSLG